MLIETQYNEQKENQKRKLIFIGITILCILCIIITVVIQIIQLNSEDEIRRDIISEENDEVEVIKFSDLFDNKINMQDYLIKQSYKKDTNKDIVYTVYEKSDKEENRYDLSVNIPTINIDNNTINDINEEILDIFKVKADDIIENDNNSEVIYTVEYTAYLNSNILSLIIKSTLKEGKNAQRVIVKGYNYNISTGEILNIEDLLLIKQLDKNTVKNQINTEIKQKVEQTEALINLGYNIYERNANDEMYKLENIDNIFYGPNGVIYIIFAYGNNNYTSELDIVTIK